MGTFTASPGGSQLQAQTLHTVCPVSAGEFCKAAAGEFETLVKGPAAIIPSTPDVPGGAALATVPAVSPGDSAGGIKGDCGVRMR